MGLQAGGGVGWSRGPRGEWLGGGALAGPREAQVRPSTAKRKGSEAGPQTRPRVQAGGTRVSSQGVGRGIGARHSGHACHPSYSGAQEEGKLRPGWAAQ